MSLNYDLSKIADHKKLCFTKVKGGFKIHPLTEALIFFTMFADMGKVTEKNAREFATRLRAYELANGPMLVYDKSKKRKKGKQPEEPQYICEGAVREHIGLETNVFPMASRIKFNKKLGRTITDRAVRMLEHEAEEEKNRKNRQLTPIAKETKADGKEEGSAGETKPDA